MDFHRIYETYDEECYVEYKTVISGSGICVDQDKWVIELLKSWYILFLFWTDDASLIVDTPRYVLENWVIEEVGSLATWVDNSVTIPPEIT